MTQVVEKKKSKLSFAARANKYARDVVRGKRKECLYVRLACQRHLNNLEAAKTAEYPYYFDREAAQLICEFIENMEHIEGEWAGDTIDLEPWQIFIYANGWGWLRKTDGMRRFREMYTEVPRKNSKSTMGAGGGLYMFAADGEPKSEVYSGATTEKQAWEVFEPARFMALNNNEFREHFGIHVGAKNLSILADGSKFEALIGKPGDGPGPHMAVIDEFHEHKGPQLYNTMKRGMGSRRQPMLWVITTAGSDTSGPCYAKRDEAIKILNGTFEDERFFAIIYTIDEEDDWTDFENWKKANPNLGVSVKEDYLRAELAEAMRRADLQNDIKCKHLDIWCNAGTSWIDLLRWAQNEEDIRLEDFAGWDCWLGLDLASKIDLVALMIMFRRPIERGEGSLLPGGENGEEEAKPWLDYVYYLFGRYYLAEETVKLPENKHYQAWQARGKLVVTPGARTDFFYVLEELRRWNKLFQIQGLGFDPRESGMLIQAVQMEMSFPCVEINQAPSQISEPMKEFDALYRARRMRHEPKEADPILHWSMGNVVKKDARTKWWYPAKEVEANKIDPTVASLMSLKLAMGATGPEKKSFWATLGSQTQGSQTPQTQESQTQESLPAGQEAGPEAGAGGGPLVSVRLRFVYGGNVQKSLDTSVAEDLLADPEVFEKWVLRQEPEDGKELELRQVVVQVEGRQSEEWDL